MASISIAYFVLCLLAGYIGRKRSIGFIGFFISALLLTPIVILLVLAVSGTKESANNPKKPKKTKALNKQNKPQP